MAETISRRSIIYDILLDFKKGKKSAKEAEKAIKKVDKTSTKLTSNLKKLGGVLAASFATQQIISFGLEAVKLAAKVQGVERAFVRLQGSKKLLIDMKEATAGTVTELELMRQAVRASNFKVPLAKLAEFFKFATLRANETGESVDFLVNSIIDGIGRKSSLVLDNLGISATELQKEIKLVGDFGEAAGNLISRALGDAEIATTDLGIATAKLNADLENTKALIGKALIPLATQLVNFFNNAVTSIDKFGLTNDKLFAALKAFNLQLTDQDFAALRAGKSTERLNKIMADYAIFVLQATKETGLLAVELKELVEQKTGDAILDAIIEGKLQDKLETTQAALKNFTDAGSTDILELEIAIGLITDALEQFNEEEEESAKVIREVSDAIAVQITQVERLKTVTAELAEIKALESDSPATDQATKDINAQNDARERNIELLHEQGLVIAESVGIAREAALAIILIKQAESIATAIASVKLAVTPIDYAISIAAVLATVAGAFATIGSFVEGTDYLDHPNAPRGVDTIPIMANRGEAIIRTDRNADKPGMAKAWNAGLIDEFIQSNFIDPAILNAQLTKPRDNIDYSSKFYREFLTSIENNSQNKSMIGLLNKIETNTSSSNTSKYLRN